MAGDPESIGKQTDQLVVGATAFGGRPDGDFDAVSVTSQDSRLARAWLDAHGQQGVVHRARHVAPTVADDAMAGLGARVTRTATDLNTGVRELGSIVRGTSTFASG